MNTEHVSTIGMLTSSNHTYFNCDSRMQVKFLKENLLRKLRASLLKLMLYDAKIINIVINLA